MMQSLILNILYPVVVRQILKVIVGVHFRGDEVLETCGQCIIVANHNSHLDTVAIMAAIPTGQVTTTKPVAAGDYFGKTGLKKWATCFFVNALLIPRSRPKPGENHPDPIKMMIDALDEGHSLILFPEGTRGEPGILQKFKKGIGLVLAERPDVPMLPVYMSGMGKLLPKGENLIVPFDNFVHFGQPVFCHGMTVEEIVERAELEILALKKVDENEG